MDRLNKILERAKSLTQPTQISHGFITPCESGYLIKVMLWLGQPGSAWLSDTVIFEADTLEAAKEEINKIEIQYPTEKNFPLIILDRISEVNSCVD